MKGLAVHYATLVAVCALIALMLAVLHGVVAALALAVLGVVALLIARLDPGSRVSGSAPDRPYWPEAVGLVIGVAVVTLLSGSTPAAIPAGVLLGIVVRDALVFAVYALPPEPGALARFVRRG